MRKGYWKILLRRLRSRVASGFDSFNFHDIPLSVTEVLASDDDALDHASILPLAAIGNGVVLLIDIGNNSVLLRAGDGADVESIGQDLPTFIDTLSARTAGISELELSLGDAEPLDLPLPKRKPLLG